MCYCLLWATVLYGFCCCIYKYLLNPRLQKFSSVLSSGSFIISCFTYRFVIDFELVFVYGVKCR